MSLPEMPHHKIAVDNGLADGLPRRVFATEPPIPASVSHWQHSYTSLLAGFEFQCGNRKRRITARCRIKEESWNQQFRVGLVVSRGSFGLSDSVRYAAQFTLRRQSQGLWTGC